MKCETIIEDAPLYVYGELGPEDEERFEAHVEGCESCRAELETLRALGRALDRHALEPSQALLVEAREGLMRAIDQGAAPAPAWFGVRDALGSLFHPVAGLRWLGAAVGLVALGFVAARVTSAPRVGSGIPPSRALADAGISMPASSEGVVSSVHTTPAGQVQISLDETSRRIISGRPEDEQIQRLLLRAARDQADPGLRVESITILKDQTSSAPVRKALLAALDHDPNPGVRLKALEGLRAFASDATVREGITRALLNDENPGVRIQAIDVLTAEHDEALVGVLQALVQKESNNYIRLRCRNALREMNASVGAF